MQSRWHRGVSTVRRERKREGEREKWRNKDGERERGKKNTRLLLILILRRHTDHTHYTDGDCVELQNT